MNVQINLFGSICLFCGLTYQSTTKVMLRGSFNLITLFLGRLRPKQLTSMYLVDILLPVTDKSVVRNGHRNDKPPPKSFLPDQRIEPATGLDIWFCTRYLSSF